MNPKREVYLLRIQYENGGEISLREIGGEQSRTFKSLEALLYYLEHKDEVPVRTTKPKEARHENGRKKG
jgi:hypothetical protein